MYREHLRELIQFVLMKYDLYSRDAEELLMLTAACESNLGHYFKQLNNGPALGIFQCEPNTLEWASVELEKRALGKIRNKKLYSVRDRLMEVQSMACYGRYAKHCELELLGSIESQILYARLIYLFKTPKAIPPHDDIELLARYWKRYWNSELGAGTIEGAIEKYNKYVK